MKNNTLLWALLVVFVALGVWYYYATSSTTSDTNSPNATSTAATTTPSQPVKSKPAATGTQKPTSTTAKVVGVGSMQFLIGLKQPLVCSIKTTTSYARSGTMYVSSDGKARLNLSNASMISDGSHLFVWMAGAIKGLELLAASSVSGSASATAGGIDPAADLSYACNPWAVDTSLFIPPASVSFFSSL